MTNHRHQGNLMRSRGKIRPENTGFCRLNLYNHTNTLITCPRSIILAWHAVSATSEFPEAFCLDVCPIPPFLPSRHWVTFPTDFPPPHPRLESALSSTMAPHTSEPKRLREVRRYYRRSSSAGIKDNLGIAVSGVSADRVSSPNNLLTALMQLLACRLNMQRAMVSVVDENNQV